MLATYKSSRLVLPAPPISIATTVFGPKAAVKGTVTERAAAVGLETSTMVIWLASGDVKARASRFVASRWPMLKPVIPLMPLGRLSTQVKTPSVN